MTVTVHCGVTVGQASCASPCVCITSRLAGVLGMTLLSKLDFPTMKFTLYFVAYTPSPTDVPEDPQDRIEATFGRCASLSPLGVAYSQRASHVCGGTCSLLKCHAHSSRGTDDCMLERSQPCMSLYYLCGGISNRVGFGNTQKDSPA